jgi:hypothetical protein
LNPPWSIFKGKENIFRDIITEASWEGIVFMALYDRNSLTLLHSNENLVGGKIDSPDIRKSANDFLSCHIKLLMDYGRYSKQVLPVILPALAGLTLHRYSIEELSERLGSSFTLISHFDHIYINPYGDPRPYIYALFKREK